METSLEERLERLEERTEAIYQSVERTRKYALIHLIGAFVILALPILGIALAIPAMLDTFAQISATMP